MATIAEQLTQLNTDLGTISGEVNTQAELIAQIKLLAEDAELDGDGSSGGESIVTLATPSISVNTAGLITSTVTQSEGYVVASTKSSTRQLTTASATTAVPGTTDRTIVSAGRYTTGDIVIKGDENLVAANIKTGTNLFGVMGSLIPLAPYLPLAIQGQLTKTTMDSWGTGTQCFAHSHFLNQSVGGLTYASNSCTVTASADGQLNYGSGSVSLEVTNNTALTLTAFVKLTSTWLPHNNPVSNKIYDYKIVEVPPMSKTGMGVTPTNSAGGTVTAATATIAGVIWNV